MNIQIKIIIKSVDLLIFVVNLRCMSTALRTVQVRLTQALFHLVQFASANLLLAGELVGWS